MAGDNHDQRRRGGVVPGAAALPDHGLGRQQVRTQNRPAAHHPQQ